MNRQKCTLNNTQGFSNQELAALNAKYEAACEAEQIAPYGRDDGHDELRDVLSERVMRSAHG
jgi:hypothetical protein